MAKPPSIKQSAPTLLPISVDVDLIRFEKNLLSIGFFGASDTRNAHQTIRRIEKEVIREGHRVKVAAEFRGSEHGLPTTADRDKFSAFLKILNEDRLKSGKIVNPVRFSGYRMIKELGLSRHGDIYEDILRWGKRMTDTTITSEQVVYLASKKVYSDDILHVFNRFRRTGSSNLRNGNREEGYEVELADWFLENLNQRFVVPEDFNVYKRLTRPIAKGIFGFLHLAFSASEGRPVEKDYKDLCNELGVQSYKHLSKIKSTMGLALDELVKIRYLSGWEVHPMVTRDGYKLVFTAGSELSIFLNKTRIERKMLQPNAPEEPVLSEVQQAAVKLLLDHGVVPEKANSLVRNCGAEKVADVVEYVETLISSKRKRVENPAGLIIYSLENSLPIPATFVSARRRQETDAFAQADRARREQDAMQEIRYAEWVDAAVTQAVEKQYSAPELQAKIVEIVTQRVKNDAAFKRVGVEQRKHIAMQLLRKEIRESLALLTFEEWAAGPEQKLLFS